MARYSAMFTRGIMCLFRLKIVGGDAWTKYLYAAMLSKKSECSAWEDILIRGF